MATCNRNEQQQAAKNNAELWKTLPETIRRGRNMSIVGYLVTDGDDDDDDDDDVLC